MGTGAAVGVGPEAVDDPEAVGDPAAAGRDPVAVISRWAVPPGRSGRRPIVGRVTVAPMAASCPGARRSAGEPPSGTRPGAGAGVGSLDCRRGTWSTGSRGATIAPSGATAVVSGSRGPGTGPGPVAAAAGSEGSRTGVRTGRRWATADAGWTGIGAPRPARRRSPEAESRAGRTSAWPLGASLAVRRGASGNPPSGDGAALVEPGVADDGGAGDASAQRLTVRGAARVGESAPAPGARASALRTTGPRAGASVVVRVSGWAGGVTMAAGVTADRRRTGDVSASWGVVVAELSGAGAPSAVPATGSHATAASAVVAAVPA